MEFPQGLPFKHFENFKAKSNVHGRIGRISSVIREFIIFKTQQMFTEESCCFTNDFSDPEVILAAQCMLMVYCNAVCHGVF